VRDGRAALSARHPGAGRFLIVIPAQAGGAFQQPNGWSSSDFALRLSRSRDLAAYAAGVSNGCRRSSHFSFAGPKEK
jgi:hypothetical protein